jgi:hypothetical protein
MSCPHLAYRSEGDGTEFETARAYCTVADRFVEPMRADICNDRHELHHERHCEIFRDHEGRDAVKGPDGGER